jgi:uncharacterized Zn-finger protein
LDDELTEENNKHFSLTFSLDRGDYFRRACPSCGRHFKTKAGAADLVAAFQPAFKQQEMEIGLAQVNSSDVATDQITQFLHCPYCGHKTEPSEMHTSTFAEYAKRYVMREVILPQLNKTFSDLEDSFGGSSSGGFLSINVKFEHHKEVLPPRPISGPEPPDMQVVELLCCCKQVKILDGWHDLITCPYCGSTCQLQ